MGTPFYARPGGANREQGRGGKDCFTLGVEGLRHARAGSNAFAP